jgi:hypothetical protein
MIVDGVHLLDSIVLDHDVSLAPRCHDERWNRKMQDNNCKSYASFLAMHTHETHSAIVLKGA